MDSPAVPDNTIQKIRTMRRCAGYPGVAFPLAIERCDDMADNKPATVMEKKVKGTTYVVSSFFNPDAKETILDKLQHIAERDVDVAALKRKY